MLGFGTIVNGKLRKSGDIVGSRELTFFSAPPCKRLMLIHVIL